jgi:hypothetical protein
MIESLAFQRRAGLPAERAMPLVFKAISVDVQRSFDLSNPVILNAIGLSLSQITSGRWWLARTRGEESLTQAVGRAAHAPPLRSVIGRIGACFKPRRQCDRIARPPDATQLDQGSSPPGKRDLDSSG